MPARFPRHVPLRSFLTAFLSSVIGLLVTASPAFAQSRSPEDPSHWGAKVSFVNSWTMAEQIKNLLGGDEEGSVLKIDGSEFEIGFVRGSRLAGA